MKCRSGGWLLAFAAGICCAPIPVDAQPLAKTARVGILLPTASMQSDLVMTEFRRAMRELGYVEGRNIVYEIRAADRPLIQLGGLAAELVRLEVDAVFARGQAAIHAAMQASQAIPIVMIDVGDPVRSGFVQSLARPGGNVTGLTTIAEDLPAKQLLLLKQALPEARRIGVLAPPDLLPRYSAALERAAGAAGVELKPVYVAQNTIDPVEIERAIVFAAQERSDALVVAPFVGFTLHLKRIAELSMRHRLPAVFWQHEFATQGGFISYGARRLEIARRSADYVDRILKGAKPRDLPVEQPRTFDLVVNLKTAGALGVTVPAPLLLQAVEVIR